MGLLPEGARVSGGDIRFDGQSLLTMGEGQRRSLLGRSISMIMQNPMTALNPVVRIGKQMTAVLRRHLQLDAATARQRALAALTAVRIRHPERVLRLYPHELSGGMCQRVLVSLAFASEPSLIIADEPTTALDVTVQRRSSRSSRSCRRAPASPSSSSPTIWGWWPSSATAPASCSPAASSRRQPSSGCLPSRSTITRRRSLPRRRATTARPPPCVRCPRRCGIACWTRPGPTIGRAPMYEVADVKFCPTAAASRCSAGAPSSRSCAASALRVGAGETLGIVGRSLRQSTLARAMLRIYRPISGALRFEGRDIATLDETALRPLRSRMQIVFQDSQSALNLACPLAPPDGAVVLLRPGVGRHCRARGRDPSGEGRAFPGFHAALSHRSRAGNASVSGSRAPWRSSPA